jgi:hypothetical protein
MTPVRGSVGSVDQARARPIVGRPRGLDGLPQLPIRLGMGYVVGGGTLANLRPRSIATDPPLSPGCAP